MLAPARLNTARPPSFLPASFEATRRAERPTLASRPGLPRSVDDFTPAPGKARAGTTPGTGTSYDGLKDKALIQALHDAVSQHKDLGYNQARKVIFTALDNHNGVVKDVYTGRELRTDKIPSSTDMNVEHTWPQSKGAVGAAKSDLHHLFPVDAKANSTRGNFPFGEVVKVQWSQNGAKFGLDAQGNKVFEPPAEHKGNVARALFYFSTVYNKPIPAGEEAVLKKWNVQDKVDSAEVARNTAIQGYQGNRNPFVDDASLASRVADF
jgi:endonuclease I